MAALFPLNHTYPLAENISVTPSTDVVWPGGLGIFTAEATFGGGTISLQVMAPTGTWLAVGTDTTMTAAGAAGFILPNGARIRVSITTATAVYAYASTMP
jgi:hypothetical protein